MQVDSPAETFSVENGVIQIAFDLTSSKAGHLVISLPEDGGGAEDEFFGQGHYVEVKDQIFGHYGGLSSIKLAGDRRLEVRLTNDVPLVGTVLTIDTQSPITEPMLSCLPNLNATEGSVCVPVDRRPSHAIPKASGSAKTNSMWSG